MPFELKNIGVTYQWMMNKIFKNQLVRIMEGYIDDMLVKSMIFKQHLLNPEEIFFVLNHYHMNLILSNISSPSNEVSYWFPGD
jgi:hypothetical protein